MCREYQSVGCKSVFTNDQCVVTHVVHNMETYLCLNSDNWIKEIQRVFNEGCSTKMDTYGDIFKRKA